MPARLCFQDSRTYHNSREVHAGNTIHNDKDPGIRQITETVVKTNWKERKHTVTIRQHDDVTIGLGRFLEATLAWKHEDEQLQVKIVGGPGGRLMLRDRGNDGNVVFCIGGVKQGVETARPRGNLT